MYNYFGFSVFKRLATLWANVGVLSHPTPGLVDVFQAGVDTGVSGHANLHELMPHSETVKFVVKLRNYFLNEFEEHKFDFPGVSATFHMSEAHVCCREFTGISGAADVLGRWLVGFL